MDWLLREVADVVVIETGGNDALRGLNVDSARANLRGIVRIVRERLPNADIVVAGMQAPTNLGPDYTRSFREMFRDVAREFDAALVPFLLEGVALDPALNQGDLIHPNREGAVVLAGNVWTVLHEVLSRREGLR
jgi:acyl-CoA thioesterase-1